MMKHDDPPAAVSLDQLAGVTGGGIFSAIGHAFTKVAHAVTSAATGVVDATKDTLENAGVIFG